MSKELYVAPHLLHGNINPAIIKELKYGGTTLAYVAAPHIIAMLNQVYCNRWDFDVIETRTDKIADLDILFTVTGKMSIRGLATRTTTASTSFVAKCVKADGRRQMMNDGVGLSGLNAKHVIWDNVGDLFKTATTDCLKKLASWFRIAEIVYGAGNEPVFVNSPPKLTTIQKNKLSKLKEELGEEELRAKLWAFDGTIRDSKELHCGNVDEFISFVESEEV